MIVEEDLEIFRLSLFTTEYKQLAKNTKSLTFCIAENNIDMIKKYTHFMRFASLYNYIFKFYSTSKHSIDLLHAFPPAISTISPFAYDYNRMIEYFVLTTKRIKQYPHILTTKSNHSLSYKPIIILGPGPSLRNNIDFIIKNRKKFIIVAFSATLKILDEFNIKPDIITLVDASNIMIEHFNVSKKMYKNVIKIFASDMYPNLIKKVGKKNLFIMESIFKITQRGFIEAPAATVGETTLHLLLSMGFKEIYLLGTDLSINIKTGSSYDKTHKDSQKTISRNILDTNIKEITLDPKPIADYIKVKGNFQKEVYTTNFFATIIGNYEKIIQKYKKYLILIFII